MLQINGTSKVITIGRGAGNSVVLNNPAVSNFHCELVIKNGVVVVTDKNSSNGVFVNGVRITTKALKKGDVVTLGSKFVFNWEDYSTGGAGSPAVPDSSSNGKSAYIIVRDPSCDRQIDNIKVSRKHCRLFLEGNSWFVEDLGSSNGTFLNGAKVLNSKIISSDILTVGGVPFSLESLRGGSKESLDELSISAQHLIYFGGEKRLIDDISLNISPGQFIGIIGGSGAGKTTLMYLICGINKPASGDVKINGESLVANPESFKGVFGYVPQDDILHRELEVRESLLYTGRLRLGHQIQEDEIDERAGKVIKKLRLQEAENVKIGSPEKKGISGGQRKKVNLGQELMTDPNILVLDEPTSGLDPRSDREVMQILRGIADEGRTVLLITHNISEANFKYFTHVIVLAKNGKLAFFGPSSEVKEYFGVEDPAQIFDELDKLTPDEWKQKFKNSRYYNNFANPDTIIKKPQNTKRPVPQTADLLNQMVTLTSRYLKIMMRDTLNLAFLLIQAPFIAILINILFKQNEGETTALFVLTVSAIWLGCSNSVREIVKERSIYKRERMVNLSIPAYLISKLAVLLLFSILQTFVLVVITSNKFNFENDFQLFFILLLASFTSTVMGLLLSAFSKTDAFALTILPLVLIPMVIFAGMVQPFRAMAESGIDILAGFWLSRWVFELTLLTSHDLKVNEMGFNIDGTGIAFSVIVLMLVCFFTGLVWKLKSLDKRK
ncbi:MAG: FHA domain-containing protein [Ignavibacteriales bacterium]|nr:FHA domain-containing protein [Ignavibacteriales bacterium]